MQNNVIERYRIDVHASNQEQKAFSPPEIKLLFFSREFFENIFIVLCPPMAALGGCEEGTRDFALLFQTVKRYCARLIKRIQPST